jgi:hypothetical protein
MLKKTLLVSVLGLLAVGGCSKSSDKAESGESGEASETAGKTTEAAKAASDVPTMTIDEAAWAVKDLSEVSPMIHVSMKVPADAKLEKNGNGGVDITIAPFYMITVGNLAVGSLAEAKGWGESSSTGDSSYKDGKKSTDEDNGFVFTYQMNDEANGTKYQAESHFYYFLEKDGAVYSINDTKPMDAFFTTGSAYTLDMANKVYGIVKSSATAN